MTAPVGQVVQIPQAQGRGVGHDNVHAAGAEQSKAQLSSRVKVRGMAVVLLVPGRGRIAERP